MTTSTRQDIGWKNILWDDPANYHGRHRVRPGTRRDFKEVKEVDGLTLFQGLRRGDMKMAVYGIRYNPSLWSKNSAWRWWCENKNKCTFFK